MVIRTYKELNDWLTENYYFEEGHILTVQGNLSENPPKNSYFF